MRKAVKFTLVPVLVVSAILLALNAAQAYTINDNYVGGAPNNSNWVGKDLIGNDYWFDVSKMDVSYSGSSLVVDVYTRYLDNIGQYETQLGDLFISTDGWKPFGSAPYNDDTAAKGETWEYAIVLDNHSPSPAQGGIATLYKITKPEQIKLSWAPANFVFRENQEVQLLTDGLNPLATGTWSIGNWGAPDSDDYLRFALNYDFGPVNELGLHWTMSCGNDVIEGGAPVPEPATMLLLGSGLVGLAGFGRKKLFKK